MKIDDKRAKILAAAEEIMSKKGLAESTISEIAREARVVDSIIYQFFKGKEDLLFSVPGERMKEVLALLDEQLQGIRDDESRLSKMIWFHLRYNDTHPGYARILLLECRSSKDFYTTPAYQLIRKYAGILLNILRQGVENGQFRPDLDIRLMRDVVLGTLDLETISCLASGEIERSATDLDDIMSLVHAIITPRKESELNKAARILIASERIFAEKGFARAKISDIAKLAQVAEGTVYEYFENKEDLLLSIPIKRFEQYLDALPEVFQIKNPLRKLKAFDSLRTYSRVIEEIIEEGKSEGSFRSDVNARVFRNMFLGIFSHLALRWVVLGKSSDIDKMQEIDRVTDLLTSAVIPYDEK
jgi:TetR/AcrR family fatty acid metabolism transcriptional regulator